MKSFSFTDWDSPLSEKMALLYAGLPAIGNTEFSIYTIKNNLAATRDLLTRYRM
ncbi:MAG TPA: hypothetical protein VII28_02590 [Puia sp.]